MRWRLWTAPQRPGGVDRSHDFGGRKHATQRPVMPVFLDPNWVALVSFRWWHGCPIRQHPRCQARRRRRQTCLSETEGGKCRFNNEGSENLSGRPSKGDWSLLSFSFYVRPSKDLFAKQLLNQGLFGHLLQENLSIRKQTGRRSGHA